MDSEEVSCGFCQRKKGDSVMKDYGRNHKRFEELQLRDDFMFGKVMQDERICKRTLEILLGIEIEAIEYPETQKTINITEQGKSVRLDVYVADNMNTVYNAEMQQKGDGNALEELPGRSRYYQGMIDLNLIEKGQPYTVLNKSYVIFICTFDPFGEGLYQYSFQYLCREMPGLVLEDGTTKLFFNTKGNVDKASEDLRQFLRYLETNEPGNAFTETLDQKVEGIRRSEKWRREYMKELLHDFDVREEGRREGREEGREEVYRMIQLLAQQNRVDDIVKAASDAAYQQKLFEELEL